MKAPAALSLLASLLGTTIAQQTTPLGSVSFNAPQCGGGKNNHINAADCNTAVPQLLSAHCTDGVCSIPPATQGAQESAISVTVGQCEVFIGAFANGNAVTFDEQSVQDAFPDFISECLATSGGFGSPLLISTDGVLRLVISNGESGGG
ncbi:uncharacterized protein TRIREDRAFT_104227 [Trichoderma reesei QM6a]|jgi:hypothetical protein|uniref:Predicted protein n=2 Tax=Hypocrea jecorina TaxID=51453 RepID=G0RBT6_HYPJQ|nr:uncharacterized protein TRIREDRAFT_104227 [Trichoderma reesei QM6a]EGR51115.1 predicted protein [Trichoderma reesei QM6a]ETS04707.1 hypothetical protein M419DRAFT_72373 [Trichoderma reesei RUT C-30]